MDPKEWDLPTPERARERQAPHDMMKNLIPPSVPTSERGASHWPGCCLMGHGFENYIFP